MQRFVTWCHQWTSPKWSYARLARWQMFFGLFAAILLTYGLISGLFFAPADHVQGEGFRIIYVHVPAASLSLSIYAFMTMSAILGLVWRVKMAFWALREAAPVGAAMTALALLTGMIWGVPMWGTYWVWDARLTSELILLFIYLAYIALIQALGRHKQADKIGAIFILVGAIDLPVVHYSVAWFHTLHQGSTLNLVGNSPIAPAMLKPLIAMIVGFIMWFGCVMCLRMRAHILEKEAKTQWVKTLRSNI